MSQSLTPGRRLARQVVLGLVLLLQVGAPAAETAAPMPAAERIRSVVPSCDIGETSGLPRLVLIGEKHFSGPSIEVRNRLIELALDNKLPLAIESADDYGVPPWRVRDIAARRGYDDSGLLHGLEPHAPYSVILSYVSHLMNLQARQVGGRQSAFANAVWAIGNLPLYTQAYDALKAELQTRTEEERLAERHRKDRIDEEMQFYFYELSPFSFSEQYANLERQRSDRAFSNPGVADMRTFSDITQTTDRLVDEGADAQQIAAGYADFDGTLQRRFLNTLHKHVIRLANEAHAADLGVGPLPVLFTREEMSEQVGIYSLFGQPSIREGSLISRVWQAKSRQMSLAVIEHLCAYAASEEQLVVIVGWKHMANIERALKRHSNGRVAVSSAFRSDRPDDHGPLFAVVLAYQRVTD